MERATAGLRALGLSFDAIATSPLARAAETAAIVAARLPDVPAPRELEALEPDVPAAETLRALRLFARSRHVLLVGHEPNLGQLLALLLTGSPDGAAIALKKGACAAVELTALAPGGGATLRWLLPPRTLRRLGRHG
ncbi:MAG: histidine phosphatase family protein [bacterium]|nr:histidine phosphatase family protein [bacterium]